MAGECSAAVHSVSVDHWYGDSVGVGPAAVQGIMFRYASGKWETNSRVPTAAGVYVGKDVFYVGAVRATTTTCSARQASSARLARQWILDLASVYGAEFHTISA